MSILLRWAFASVIAGVVWLAARYAYENSRPYQKIPAFLRD